MHILVINCGSSSIRADIVNTEDGSRTLSMTVDRILAPHPEVRFLPTNETITCPQSGHQAALEFAFPLLLDRLHHVPLSGIGHRIVHGGTSLIEPVRIEDEVEKQIEALHYLAPLHNPINLLGIRAARKAFPDLPHIAVMDTAFHATLPVRAQLYALPHELIEKYKIRRYGFHGTSHQYVAQLAVEYLHTDMRNLRLITCHLGNGCSVDAIEYGRSVETSMGMTPLEGLVMGTRAGDVDLGVILYLMEQEKLTPAQMNELLNKESGLKGISGIGNDMRDIEARAAEGDQLCQQAIHVFTHRLRKYIGAYAAVMGGVDAIIFTGGIGENSAMIRHRVCQRLDFLGAILDEDHNRFVKLSREKPVDDISFPHSRCKLLVAATDEQLAIARQSALIVQESNKVKHPGTIPVAVSARHIHLTQETVEQLFGPGHQLTVRRPLSQPGQYSCEETVTLVGTKNQIEGVRILGPTRKYNQVEISRTDEFFLGIDAPVRESGHVQNTPGITLVGPAGKVDLKEGLICAWRHIHMAPEDAAAFGVKDTDVVEVRVETGDRSLTFGDVLVRVSPNYALEMHIDTDEANAANLSGIGKASLIETEGKASLMKKKV